jgi:hypothetical protein
MSIKLSVACSSARIAFLDKVREDLNLPSSTKVIYRMITFFYQHPELLPQLNDIKEKMPNDRPRYKRNKKDHRRLSI